jgi:hypothetical protein
MYAECLTSHLCLPHKLEDIFTAASKQCSYKANSLSWSKSALEV